MRSFLLASAALCLTCVFAGCDAPVEPAKPPVTPPPVAEGKPEPGKPAEGEGKMAPAPAPAPEKPPTEKMEPPK